MIILQINLLDSELIEDVFLRAGGFCCGGGRA